MPEHRGRDGEALSWNHCQEAFKVDGSLRDIYVFNTNTRDWDRFLDLVRSSTWSWSYMADASPELLPECSQQVFTDTERTNILYVQLGSIEVACHFFCPEDFEFCVDPREVQSQDAMDRLLEFVRRLGRCIEKEVVVTEEDSPNWVWFRYQPASDATTFEARSVPSSSRGPVVP